MSKLHITICSYSRCVEGTPVIEIFLGFRRRHVCHILVPIRLSDEIPSLAPDSQLIYHFQHGQTAVGSILTFVVGVKACRIKYDGLIRVVVH